MFFHSLWQVGRPNLGEGSFGFNDSNLLLGRECNDSKYVDVNLHYPFMKQNLVIICDDIYKIKSSSMFRVFVGLFLVSRQHLLEQYAGFNKECFICSHI